MPGTSTQGGSAERCASEDDFPDMEDNITISKARWIELMLSLQNVAKLHRAAARAQIDGRQKSRQASFKRQDVWTWDAKFMDGIQKLNAQDKFQGFEDLSRIAAECQTARDFLGPLEQDIIEAESHWQGQIWKLREAEENLYTEFEDEFCDASEYAAAYGSQTTVSDQSSLNSRNQHFVPEFVGKRDARSENLLLPVFEPTDQELQASTPLDLNYAYTQEFKNTYMESNTESGIGNIDSILELSPRVEIKSDSATKDKAPDTNCGSLKSLSRPPRVGIGIYHDLLVSNFSTRRERINKWLEHTVLESRLEALSLFSILQEILKLEDKEVPSNWAQLVIAYWEQDHASKFSSEGESHSQSQHVITNSQVSKSDTRNESLIPRNETHLNAKRSEPVIEQAKEARPDDDTDIKRVIVSIDQKYDTNSTDDNPYESSPT